MLTTAFGFLLSGPIESIDTNVQEIVRAITCLYEQVWIILYYNMIIVWNGELYKRAMQINTFPINL